MLVPNKVVVITGSSSGIGLALAQRFAAEGARLILADLVEGPAVTSEASQVRFRRTDLGVDAEIQALVEDVLAEEGTIDLFVSNAGIGTPMGIDATEADWEKIIAVNQLSHVRVARYVVPAMLARGGGHILITASAAALVTSLTSAGYLATKHAALGFAEWLAIAYRHRGIGVSVLCPGSVRTPLIQGISYLQRDAIEPEEVAEKVIEGLAAEKFLITTHADTLPQFQQKAANYDGFIEFVADLREKVLVPPSAEPHL